MIVDPITVLEGLEVGVGLVALVYAVHLQFIIRAKKPYAVFMFWALGAVLISTHAGNVFGMVAGPKWAFWTDAVAIFAVFVGMTAVWVRVVRDALSETDKDAGDYHD